MLALLRTTAGADAVQGGAVLGLEQLHWLNEGCRVGAEVGEEEGHGVEEDEEPHVDSHNLVVPDGQDDQDASHHGETLEYTPPLFSLKFSRVLLQMYMFTCTLFWNMRPHSGCTTVPTRRGRGTHHPVDEHAAQDLNEGDGEPVAGHSSHHGHGGVTGAGQVDLAVHLVGAGADALRGVVGEDLAQVEVGVGRREQGRDERLDGGSLQQNKANLEVRLRIVSQTRAVGK